jgi:hypothetical protein
MDQEKTMKRIALVLIGGLIGSALVGGIAAKANLLWAPADPDQVVAYKVGAGVITIASESLLSCEAIELIPEAKPFVYDFNAGRPGGMLCLAKQAARIAAYYQPGSPSSVKVNTKAGTITVTVTAAPPGQP